MRSACEREPLAPAHGVSVSRSAAPSPLRIAHESNRRFSPFAPTSWTPPAASACVVRTRESAQPAAHTVRDAGCSSRSTSAKPAP